MRYDVSLLTDFDIFLFKQGNHFHLYEKLGSHPMTVDGLEGFFFAVWAPDAETVSVIGDFNEWNRKKHPLKPRDDQSGIWEGFIPGIPVESLYKYRIKSKYNRYRADKGDPFAFRYEASPGTSSLTSSISYEWGDGEWMEKRKWNNSLGAPFSVYEAHLGSWKRVQDETYRFLSYRELADDFVGYIRETGFTHVELLPVMEHPFYGSWGYQTTGYFAPTARYGSPQDLMYLIDCFHRNGIGVILDWVPSHFPSDEHGLGYFDGTHLFEHADTRKGFHPDWKSCIFNYGRNEVRSFLISSAIFWLDKYHADGLRIDAVASMLYLDYSRQAGEWIPNKYGGRENIEAIELIRRLNEAVYAEFPDTQTIAEESTAWPMVTRPTYLGGLGFGMKWNMGWMHDTLDYFSKNPVHRKHHHNQLTFSIWYAFHENFLLPLSHDEVVHGKKSILSKMPDDDWQKFANLRLLYAYFYAHPGKKLLFMGSEFGQWQEWNHEESLSWHLLDHAPHRGLHRLVADLNRFYRSEPALYEADFVQSGFEWIDIGNWEESIICFLRKSPNGKRFVVVAGNCTPKPRYGYRVGVPAGGFWTEVINTDSEEYWGSGHGNFGGMEAENIPFHGRPFSLNLTLPPLSAVMFRHVENGESDARAGG